MPRAGKVTLAIYDVRGRLVNTLVDAWREPGRHTAVWRGRDRHDRTVAAGVYLVRLKAGGQATTRGVTLLK